MKHDADIIVNTETPFISKKLGLTIGIATILSITLIFSWWVLSPSWEPLFGGSVTPETRLEARSLLMNWGVSFEEEKETGFILIKDTLLTEVRSRMADAGIPANYSPGLELFNEAEYGMSEFTQKINYQRAIESEIAETIRSFADVSSARVHLTIPKESIFRDKQVLPKASVVIKTKPGKSLSREQVTGISELVSASVENLTTENIMVIDENGTLVSSDKSRIQYSENSSTKNIEAEYEKKARSLVEGMVQGADIHIAVNANFNYDVVKSIREKIIPPNDQTQGFLAKTRKQNTSTPKSQKSIEEIQNNASIVEEEYVFSKERSEIEYATGKVEKISIGIVVVKEVSQVTIHDIKTVVASGLGLDSERGDEITVVSIAPLTLFSEEPKPTTHIDLSSKGESPVSRPLEKNLIETHSISKPWLLIAALVSGIFVTLLVVFGLQIGNRRTSVKALSLEERDLLLSETRAWIAAEKNKELA